MVLRKSEHRRAPDPVDRPPAATIKPFPKATGKRLSGRAMTAFAFHHNWPCHCRAGGGLFVDPAWRVTATAGGEGSEPSEFPIEGKNVGFSQFSKAW